MTTKEKLAEEIEAKLHAEVDMRKWICMSNRD